MTKEEKNELEKLMEKSKSKRPECKLSSQELKRFMELRGKERTELLAKWS